MYAFAVPPRPTSTTGPKRLTFSGIAALVLAVASVVGALWSMLSMPYVGVMDHRGGTGSKVVVTLQPGETTTVALDAGTRYQLWLLTSTNIPDPQYPAPSVVGPDGSDVSVTDSTPYDFLAEGYHYAYGLWEMTTTGAGGYTITVPVDDATTDVSVAATPAVDARRVQLLADLTFTLWFAAPALGFVGFSLTLAGGIWWGVRRQRARTPRWPTPPFYPPPFPPPPP